MDKKSPEKNRNGISICDSIVMSVKKKRMNLRQPEAVFIAVMGFVSVIMSFFSMFSFRFTHSSVFFAAVIFSVVYITLALMGRRAVWIVLASAVAFAVFAYKVIDTIGLGYKYVYNVIYHKAYFTDISYYKFLEPELEEKCTTAFFIMCIWFLAMIIYYFTICKPNPILPVAVTFPIIEVGLYNGIELPLKWGVLIVAYWLALFAMSTIDLGEYSGGSGGFVRKDNLFFPKRQMRLKVTEACGMLVIAAVVSVALISAAALKLSHYQRSDELNRKRINIRDAVSSFTINDIAESINNITNAFGFNFKYENHKLGNVDRLRYKDQVDLVVNVSHPSYSAIYLKDYTGSVYQDNKWDKLDGNKYNVPMFDLFRKYGMHPQDFAGVFSQYSLPDYYENTSAVNNIIIESKLRNDKSFIPYSALRDGNTSYLNDTYSVPHKSGSKYSVPFIANDISAVFSKATPIMRKTFFADTSPEQSALTSAIIEYCSAHDLINYDNFISIDTEYNYELTPDSVMAQLMQNEYKKFVYENYLQLPDSVEMNEVRAAYSDEINAVAASASPVEKYDSLIALRDKLFAENDYSLSPGKTPTTRDFVNYFLLENHKGFCTHFATAGVILCRMAGIPARYATGYVIVGDDFNEKNRQDNDSYTFSIKDNRSHAWTEIYVDGFGWQPFEFTEGYSNQSIDTTPATTTTETEPVQTTYTTTVAVSTTTGQTTSRDPDATTDKNQPAHVHTTTPVTTDSGTGILPGGSEGRTIPESVKYFIFFTLLIAAVLAVVLIRRRIILDLRAKHFSEGSNSEKMKYIYQYAEKLLSSMNIEQNDMNFMDFAGFADEKLSGRFTDKNSFVDFVKVALKAQFSQEEPDDNEVTKCKLLVTSVAEKQFGSVNKFRKFVMKYISVLI